MSPATITASDAVRNFSGALKRAHKEGGIIIEKNGRPYAALAPINSPLTGSQILKELSRRPHVRFTPEEALAFANDLEQSRKILNVPPVSKW